MTGAFVRFCSVFQEMFLQDGWSRTVILEATTKFARYNHAWMEDTENSENHQGTSRGYIFSVMTFSFISQLDLNPCKKKTNIWILPEEDIKNSENHQCTFKR
jgi:hypothetical protein